MKKIICLLLALVFALSLTGCTYNPIDPSTPPTPPTSGSGGNEGGENEDESETKTFTVNLVDESGNPFTSDNLKVIWSNRTSAVTADVTSQGKATAKLDGDYKVTLQNVPDGYTYNPNIYYVSNRNTDVTVLVYKLNVSYNDGSTLYDHRIDMYVTGAYRAVIKSKEDCVYYMFEPTHNGYYTIESCVDTTFNEVNPFMDVYFGNPQAAYYDYTLDDGSDYCDTYTKNFSYTFKRAQDEVKTGFVFAIHATHKTHQYPVYVDFIVSRGEEDYERPSLVGKPISATENFSEADFTWETGTWTWAEKWSTKTNSNVFDADNFMLGEDGYYHLKDLVTGEITDKKLYVMLKTSISERPFLNYNGATVSLYALATLSGPPTDPLKNVNGFKYHEFVIAYSNYCNSDGVYPLTEEMRILLQNFAIAQRYFADGEGTFETANGIYAEENDMWLFACGYYA